MTQETWHNYFYNFMQDFPNASRVWSGSFEQVYFADREDTFYFIYDGRLALDFIVAFTVSDDERRKFILNPDQERHKNSIYQDEIVIQIIAFDSVEQRADHLEVNYVRASKMKIMFEKKLEEHTE